ncbi:GNAT family N-acetyltransferase [Kocuria coralli]|nr:GNAT family N-acetyltransferase [Kocuria coralli]
MPHEPMPYEIVPAVPGDGPSLHALAAVTFHDACPPGTDRAVSDAHVARELSAERFESWLADPRYHLLVLLASPVEQGKASPAGYAMLVQDEPIRGTVPAKQAVAGHRGATWFLSKLYVHPDHRGTGAASRLLEASKHLAAESGATRLWLTVNQLNARANAFYERSGLGIVGTATFPMGNMVHDDFVRLTRL